MHRHNGSRFLGTTVVLDGNEYRGCTFEGCHVVVGRGNFVLVECTSDDCTFDFVGEAKVLYDLASSVLENTADGSTAMVPAVSSVEEAVAS